MTHSQIKTLAMLEENSKEKIGEIRALVFGSVRETELDSIKTEIAVAKQFASGCVLVMLSKNFCLCGDSMGPAPTKQQGLRCGCGKIATLGCGNCKVVVCRKCWSAAQIKLDAARSVSSEGAVPSRNVPPAQSGGSNVADSVDLPLAGGDSIDVPSNVADSVDLPSNGGDSFDADSVDLPSTGGGSVDIEFSDSSTAEGNEEEDVVPHDQEAWNLYENCCRNADISLQSERDLQCGTCHSWIHWSCAWGKGGYPPEYLKFALRLEDFSFCCQRCQDADPAQMTGRKNPFSPMSPSANSPILGKRALKKKVGGASKARKLDSVPDPFIGRSLFEVIDEEVNGHDMHKSTGLSKELVSRITRDGYFDVESFVEGLASAFKNQPGNLVEPICHIIAMVVEVGITSWDEIAKHLRSCDTGFGKEALSGLFAAEFAIPSGRANINFMDFMLQKEHEEPLTWSTWENYGWTFSADPGLSDVWVATNEDLNTEIIATTKQSCSASLTHHICVCEILETRNFFGAMQEIRVGEEVLFLMKHCKDNIGAGACHDKKDHVYINYMASNLVAPKGTGGILGLMILTFYANRVKKLQSRYGEQDPFVPAFWQLFGFLPSLDEPLNAELLPMAYIACMRFFNVKNRMESYRAGVAAYQTKEFEDENDDEEWRE